MELDPAVQGIHAQEEANRKSMGFGIDVQQKMGELAMLPAKYESIQAQARLHTAQAGAAETEAASAKSLLDVQKRFMEYSQEKDARAQLSEAGKASGRLLTMDDLPKSGSVVNASQADELEAFANFAKGSLPPMAMSKLRTEIATIKQKEAAAAHSQATTRTEQSKQMVAQMETLGNIAGAAGLSEANYRAIMLSPQRAMLPRELTGNYRTDAPVLRAIEQASQDSIKRAKLENELLDSQSKRRLDGARTGQAGAAISNLEARTKQIKQDIAQAEKTGGKYSPEAIELRKAQTKNQLSLAKAREAKMFPPMPITNEDFIPNANGTYPTYTFKGQLYDVVGKDAKGKIQLAPHVGSAPATPVDSAVDDAPDLTDDNLED
ncbi:MAG: hypothetical protein JZU60_02660 [Ilumatobacteraceae bacterium]|nr:hypothetical protein [Ilumatobacteraceae bacterium]